MSSRPSRRMPAGAFPVVVAPATARSWVITLPFVPISVNRLYRPTERRGQRALTEEAKREREAIGIIASLSGFRPEPSTLYGVRVTFTLAGPSGDLDNFFKQLLDSIFGQEADRHIVRLEADKRVERGMRQTDITIWEMLPRRGLERSAGHECSRRTQHKQERA